MCEEIEVQLSRHRSRSFDEMKQWGDDLSSFDLVVALSPASQRRALELTRLFHLTVESVIANLLTPATLAGIAFIRTEDG